MSVVLGIKGGRKTKKRPWGRFVVWQLFNSSDRQEKEKGSVGSGLLSHTVTHAVPSALVSLTSGFGMEPGGPSRLGHQHTHPLPLLSWSVATVDRSTVAPHNCLSRHPATSRSAGRHSTHTSHTTLTRAPASPHHMGNSPRPLVPVRSRHCCPSTSGLSSWSSPSGLTWFPSEASHLEAGFPLRCFQRLSSPEIATRRCTWRYNRHTSAPSTPVLSY